MDRALLFHMLNIYMKWNIKLIIWHGDYLTYCEGLGNQCGAVQPCCHQCKGILASQGWRHCQTAHVTA